MIAQIRDLVARHGRLNISVESLKNHDSLWAAGLASFAAVQLLLALEDSFEVEFAESGMIVLDNINIIASNVVVAKNRVIRD